MPTPSPTPLREVYTKVLNLPKESAKTSALWKHHVWTGPLDSDVAKWQAQGFSVYQGKIRTILSREGRVQLLHSDRITAFDTLIDHIPGKGVILTAISRWWFERLRDQVPIHFIESPSPRSILADFCAPYKVEIVVRGYLAGSMLRAYEKGERVFCGVTLPEGLKGFQKLPVPIITPTTKAAAFYHDENISAEDVIATGLCNTAEWEEICRLAHKVFEIGSAVSLDRGWILADAKYEFGKSRSGQIKLIDEVHTPDSARFWKAGSYQSNFEAGKSPDMQDKEIVRRWLQEQGFQGQGAVPNVPAQVLIGLGLVYLDLAKSLTGEELLSDPIR